ncbi:MAG: nucleotidyltransferase domain-containing protein [Candidatus Pacearchaeota archaeon]
MDNITLDTALSVLLNLHFIKKEGRELSLNFEKEETKLIISLVSKQYKMLKELPLCVYFSIVDILSNIVKIKETDVYLFGSYAKLIFKEGSDIDLAIISDNLTQKDKRELNKIIRKTELRYGTKIELHYFSKRFYKNKQDPLVREILKNGVKLI